MSGRRKKKPLPSMAQVNKMKGTGYICLKGHRHKTKLAADKCCAWRGY